MTNGKKFSAFLFALALILTVLVLPAFGEDIITKPDDFLNALKKGVPEITVDDITFPEDTLITLNYDVKITGGEKKATLKNACFVLNGSNIPGESIHVIFDSLILDGGIQKEDYAFPSEGDTFYSVFSGSNREDKQAISGTWGYFSFTMTGCEITGYASYTGPALEVDNNELFRGGKRIVTLKDCVFHHNISYEGTIALGNDNGIFTVEDCVFTENTAKQGAGAILSNGKVNVSGCRICDNCYYPFIKSDEEGNEILPAGQVELKGYTYNVTGITGSLFTGAADAVISDTVIFGNEGEFGGGIGITSPDAVTGESTVKVIGCTIRNNKAVCGGGAYLKSGAGHTICFIDCDILENEAEKGGALYTTTIAPFTNKKGGNNRFIFCTIAQNKDQDAGSFVFHETHDDDTVKGFIELSGCLVVDEGKVPPASDFTYAGNTEKALSDGVFSKEMLESVPDGWLMPLSGSPADITVPAAVYSVWDKMYSKETAPKKLGAHSPVEIEPLLENLPKEENETDEISSAGEKKNRNWIWILIPAAAVLILIPAVRKPKKEKKAPPEKPQPEKLQIDYSALSREKLLEIIKEKYKDCNLTAKETQVASFLLTCDKRKDIADALFVSEDTVKTHISHIFKKVGVSSREEFRELTEKQ